jgi:hypothetical protein
MMRQVAGAAYEKGQLVAKRRTGRQPKRKETGNKVARGNRTPSFGRRSLRR